MGFNFGVFFLTEFPARGFGEGGEEHRDESD